MKINERKEFISFFPPTHSVVGKSSTSHQLQFGNKKKKTTVDVQRGASHRPDINAQNTHTTDGPINFDFFPPLAVCVGEGKSP
jgi:hypothetical protein